MKNIAHPYISVAKQVFDITSKKVMSSFIYLLEKTNHKQSKLYELIHEHKDTHKAAPFFFAAHEILTGHFCYNKNHKNHVIEQLLNIEAFTHYSRLSILPFHENRSIQESACLHAIHSDLRATYADVEKNDAFPKPFGNLEEYYPSEDLLKKAIAIIKAADSALFDEIEFVVDEIRVFKSDYLRAGTNFNTLGLIYIGKHSAHDNVSRYIEHIAHESAHTLLYSHWTVDPIFNNHNDQLYYTPFRKDLRPLSAIFHAMFVLARTVYAFDVIHKNAPLSIDFSGIHTNYNEQGNDKLFKEKFMETAELIYREAKLTDYGKKIVDDCTNMMTDCNLEI